MMKFLKKINRGLILTVFVVLAVIIYLVSLGIYNASQKPVLEKLTEEFLEVYLQYEMLPEEFRVLNHQMSKEEQEKFLSEMKTELSRFYPEEEMYFEFALTNKKSRVNSLFLGQRAVKSYDKRIINFENFVFENNTADVTFKTLTTIEVYVPGMDQVQKLTDETMDQIIFMKLNGSWNVIHAEINEPHSGMSDMPVFR